MFLLRFPALTNAKVWVCPTLSPNSLTTKGFSGVWPQGSIFFPPRR